jgi:dTDP-4-amino-4,6-dideoxygalactose transaminase
MPISFNACQYYGKDIKYEEGLCPVVERIGKKIIMLPMHPNLTMKDAEDVIGAVRKVAAAYSARIKR